MSRLYLIEILHQTTTCWHVHPDRLVLYLIEILHQTTTAVCRDWLSGRCILLKFYIKPQQQYAGIGYQDVVSY